MNISAEDAAALIAVTDKTLSAMSEEAFASRLEVYASAVFLRALIDESFIGNPQDLHRRICKTWNRAVTEVPDWPNSELAVPSYRETYSLPWSTFQQAFGDEVGSTRPSDEIMRNASCWAGISIE